MTVKYTKDHEWVRFDNMGATVGISEHAAEQLGDVVFVELPAVGRKLSRGDAMAVVESVKAASDVYAPISGDVIEINQAIVDDPAKVNADPAGAAWFVRLQPSNPSEADELMNEAAYQSFLGTH